MRSARSKIGGGILAILLVISLVATFSIAAAQVSPDDGWTTDSDGDGLMDASDNCPNSHGGTNSIDGCPDDDGDGVPNHEDKFPNDPDDYADQDNDGIGDNAEGRKDNRDSDDDGTLDFLDDDSDEDGILDFIEGDEDTDGDDIPNYLDNDSDNDDILDSEEGDEDADNDGIPNFLDDDSDGDGYSDAEEGQDDTDNDGTKDYLDTDSDGDGLSDEDEKDNGTKRTVKDTDGDGLFDGDEVNTHGTNPNNPDTDGDTLNDAEEVDDTIGSSYVSDPLSKDTDDDGLEDNEEISYVHTPFQGINYPNTWSINTDPSNPDTDADGLSDFEEISRDNYHITNPTVEDTDGDGIDDGIDNCPGVVNADQKDRDGDGIGTECDPIELIFSIIPSYDNTITEGPYLFNEEITFSAEESYSFGSKLSEEGTATITWIFPDGTLNEFDGTADASAGTGIDLTFENSGKFNVTLEGSCVSPSTTNSGNTATMIGIPNPPIFYRNNFDCTEKDEVDFEVEITNGLYAVISKPTADTIIQPNQQLLFEEASYSLGEPIDSWIIDFGDESQPYGYLSFDQQYKCYSSTVATQFCSTNILTVGGNFEDGAACGCGDYTTEIFPTTVVDITNFAGRKTGHTYDSLESCGDDFICTVTLTVGADEDDDGTIDFTSSTTLDLPFSESSVCSEFPDAEICATGELTLDNLCERAPDLETCQDDAIPPEINITSGNFTNETKNLDTLDPKITGQDSYVSKKPAKKQQYSDPLDNIDKSKGLGTGGKDKGSSGTGTILAIIILISALIGVGFFLWKKGMLGGGSKSESTPSEATPTPAEPEPAEEEKSDSGSEIQSYIDKAKVAGESNDQMKEGLKAAGWPDSEINKYL